MIKNFRSLPAAALAFCLLGRAAPNANADPNLDLARQLNQAFVDVAAKVSPSVVVINVTQKPESAGDFPTNDSSDDPLDSFPPGFWRNFHEQFKHRLPETAEGSGVILRENGYILTNGHVVEDADKIEVRLLDGRTFNGTIRGVDPVSDLAVIKIDATNLPVATFADSSKVRVGEFAIAIGAPFTYDYTVTFGHVSAKGRSNVIPAFEGGAAMDQDFIQTDANINPGNSGGPLLNIEGQVIGINTMIHGLHTGIGFAIAGNLVKDVSDLLINYGKVQRAWLGIGISAVKDDPDFRRLSRDVSSGVVVHEIISDGPAAHSDLQTGDVITALDGTSVATPQQLRNAVRRKPVGTAVTLDVVRAGKKVQLKITPAEYADPELADASQPAVQEKPQTTGLGIKVQALNPELADQFGATASNGVVVTSVEQDSPAARKHIQPGDIITRVGQQDVSTPQEFRDALNKADLKKGVIVNLLSGTTERFEILKQSEE